jgi:predicted RNA-binding protein with PIN domain
MPWWNQMFLIDGTNLLWAIRDLDEREITNELQLCQVIDGYLAATQQKGQAVFDGAGPIDREVFAGVRHLDIFFAGPGQDADSVIEGKILVDSAPKRLIVVSNDRRLRESAVHRKAKAVSCEDFWEQVQTHLHRNKPKRKEPPEKRQGLSDGETDQWMELFGLP